MPTEIVLNEAHGQYDVILHALTPAPPVLLGAAPSVVIGARAAQAVQIAGGHLSAGWRVLCARGGVPNNGMATYGGVGWPRAVRRWLAVRAVAAEMNAAPGAMERAA